jgi:L-threonylcarbamoyladenylate synthase
VIDAGAVALLHSTLVAGGIGLVPTDTVYGLAAALDSPEGVAALYALKDRPRAQPCQVLIYSPSALDAVTGGLDPTTARAVRALLPGSVTCIVEDLQRRFIAAAGERPGSVGLRAPNMSGPISGLDLPLIATSANDLGGRDPAVLTDVPDRIREAVDIEVDGGRLPGTASAVIDLRDVGRTSAATLIRSGPSPANVRAALQRAGVLLLG